MMITGKISGLLQLIKSLHVNNGFSVPGDWNEIILGIIGKPNVLKPNICRDRCEVCVCESPPLEQLWHEK